MSTQPHNVTTTLSLMPNETNQNKSVISILQAVIQKIQSTSQQSRDCYSFILLWQGNYIRRGYLISLALVK